MVVRRSSCNALRGSTIVLLRRELLKYCPAVYFMKVGDFAPPRRGATAILDAIEFYIHSRFSLYFEDAVKPRRKERSDARCAAYANIPWQTLPLQFPLSPVFFFEMQRIRIIQRQSALSTLDVIFFFIIVLNRISNYCACFTCLGAPPVFRVGGKVCGRCEYARILKYENSLPSNSYDAK